MQIENIPEAYIDSQKETPDLFVYDFKMTSDVVKSKVNLGMNMFSFLQVGKKQVHFAGTSVAVNKEQSLLLKKGNWLWTELLEAESVYNCKLFFFSDKILKSLRIFNFKQPVDSEGCNTSLHRALNQNKRYIYY